MHNWTPGEEITAEKLNDLNPGADGRISELQHNILELFFDNYFAGKTTPYRDLWFDGFSDNNKACLGSGTTTGDTNSGQNQIILASSGQANSFTVGNMIHIFGGGNEDFKTITGISGATLTLDGNFTHSYGSGSTVKETSAAIDTANKRITLGSSGTGELYGSTLFSDPNLVSYYRLETDGADSKGSHGLTNNGVIFSPAKYGNGANFGSVNTGRYLSAGTDFGVAGGACSFCFWVQMLAQPATNSGMFLFDLHSNTGVDWAVIYQDVAGVKQLFFRRTRPGVVDDGPVYSVDLGTSNLHHIAMIYDGIHIHGYIDGIDVTGAFTATGTGGGQPNWFTLGSGNSGGGGGGYGSLIDDFAVFSRALSASEIANLSVIPVNKSIYQARKTTFFQEISNLRIWVSRKIVASYNFLNPVAPGSTNFTLAGDMTLKIKSGDYIDVRNAANTKRQRLTIYSSNLTGGNTNFTTAESFLDSYGISDFVERVDSIPKVSLVNTGSAAVFDEPSFVKSLLIPVDGESLVEDEYTYTPLAAGHDLNMQIIISRNDPDLNPYTKRLGVSLNS